MTTDRVKIYVRSSPLGPVGIHWRNVTNPEQPKEDPEILMEQVVPDGESKVTVNSAIYDVKPCLILAKYSGKIFLEVTGLEAAPDRSAKLGRRISEVVLWVGDDDKKTEERLRKLAYCALLGLWNPESKFRTVISASIEFDGLNDYKVNVENLLNIYDDPKDYISEELLIPGLDLIDQISQDWLVKNDLERIEANEEVLQLANRLLQASFEGLDVAIAIAEIKQKEKKICLNYRTHIVEKIAELPKDPESEVSPPPINPPLPPIPPQPPKPDGKKKLLLALLGLLLILLIALLWIGQKHLESQGGTTDQNAPVLNVIPLQ